MDSGRGREKTEWAKVVSIIYMLFVHSIEPSSEQFYDLPGKTGTKLVTSLDNLTNCQSNVHKRD